MCFVASLELPSALARYPNETLPYPEASYLKSGAWSGEGSMRQPGEGVEDGEDALGDAGGRIATFEDEHGR